MLNVTGMTLHMRKIQKILTVSVIGVICLLLFGAFLLLTTSKVIFVDGKLYKYVENYSHPDRSESAIRSGCHAMSPECGVCAGEGGAVLRGDHCYVAL